MAIPFPGAFRARQIQADEVIAEAARWARAGEALAGREAGRGPLRIEGRAVPERWFRVRAACRDALRSAARLVPHAAER